MKIFRTISKITFSLVFTATALNAAAQLGQDGYYRVHNAITGRYIYITDNKGKINTSATSVDALAIQLWKSLEKANSDPATVLYFEKKSQGHISAEYNITSQKTGIYEIIGRYVTIRKTGDNYFAYGSESGMVKYLGDANASNDAEGSMSSEVDGDRRKWNITPITATGDNYFGALPTVTAAGKHYAPMHASFPFSAHSQGVKIYVITTCAYGMAVAEEVKGTIPAHTSCFIECPSTSPSGNRLNVGGTPVQVSGNLLAGVYFENYMTTHLNLTPYDPKTMRVLGTMPDGSLGYVTADIQNLPANRSYLKVPAGSPANIKVVSREEYNAAVAAMPTGITLDQSSAKLYEGATLQLRATLSPATASAAGTTWTSSDNAVATVSETGAVTARGKGTATITATTVNGLKASCTVTVAPKYPESVAITPANLIVYIGETGTLTATISPEDVEQKDLTWSTSDASVATVENGIVTALKVGTVNVTVTTANGKTAVCPVTVAPIYPQDLTLDKKRISIYPGQETTLTPIFTPEAVKESALTWTSSNESVATVDNGVVRALKSGSAVITATTVNGISATCDVTVYRPVPDEFIMNHPELTIEVGDEVQLKVNPVPEEASTSARWTTSDNAIVQVSVSGRITAKAAGTAVITATSRDKGEVTATCTVTVLMPGTPAEKITVTPGALELEEGQTAQLTAEIEPWNVSNKFIIWTSNNESIAKVDATGKVTAIKAGNIRAIITARCGKASATVAVSVNQSSGIPSLEVNEENDGLRAVYTPDGHLVNPAADEDAIRSLDPGLYIVGGKKVVVK